MKVGSSAWLWETILVGASWLWPRLVRFGVPRNLPEPCPREAAGGWALTSRGPGVDMEETMVAKGPGVQGFS